jgi:hypothetical protein
MHRKKELEETRQAVITALENNIESRDREIEHLRNQIMVD